MTNKELLEYWKDVKKKAQADRRRVKATSSNEKLYKEFGRYVREVNKIIKEVEEKIEREGADTTNGGIIDPENEYLWKEYMK